MSAAPHRIDPGLDLLQLHARHPLRYPYLLESAATGTAHGRFDILFALPQHCLWLGGDRQLHGAPENSHDFLDALDRLWRNEATEISTDLPYRSGWFVYLGYELAGQIEPSLKLHWSRDWPAAFATRMGGAIIRDHSKQEVSIVADDPDRAVPLLLQDIADLRADSGSNRPDMMISGIREESARKYIDAVEQAKRYINAGDVFQANLSREWRATVFGPVADVQLYRRLRKSNPGPFAGLVRWHDNAIISSSPERLLKINDGRIETRPIAGTRPRGSSLAHDLELSRELFAHPKERAEHIMLIDLERNDLGRVCEPGTVEVDEFMSLESYSHVHHIVSNISGKLRAGVSPADAMRAVFPGGTITGCPKVRCMEIIDQLEGAARGAYTGSFGYLDRSGNCDLNILIRTLVRTGCDLSLRAGAGIVADSVAEREVEETRAKARGLLLALAPDTA